MVRPVVLLTVCMWLSGCGPGEEESGQPVTAVRECVTTTFYPTTWLAEQIMGSAVSVECIVPNDEDPAVWRPDDNAVQKLQSSKLIVLNGAGFEKWATMTTLPASRVVDTTAELPEPLIRYENAITHQHGPAGDQSREGIDEHTWLDPILAKHQATRIADAAKRAWPSEAGDIDTNLRSIHEQLDAVDARLKALTPKLAGVRLRCMQPAYNYIARRYSWEIESLELSEGDDVSDRPASDEKPTIVLTAAPPDDKIARGIDALRISVVIFAPGVSRPESGDFFSLMNANIDALEKAIAAATGDNQ